MNCADLRAAYLADDLAESERQHLAGCAACRAEQPTLDGGKRLLADPGMWEEPDPRLEERVVTLISESPLKPASPSARHRPWRLAVAASFVGVLAVSLALWALARSPGADWMVPIPGTVEAPNALGVVEGWNEPAGTRVMFSVAGLAPAPAGSVYEFWFSSEELHVSAGTFTGSGEVELWVGVSRGHYPRPWVTLEPIDRDETPSGVTVLDTGP